MPEQIPDTGSTTFLRAEAAAASLQRFIVPVLGVPATRVARTQWPSKTPTDFPWNYWWQAHVLDCLVDASLRHAALGDQATALRWHRDGHRFLRGVLLRNGLRFANHYYDDMAWMALAVQRLSELSRLLGRPSSRLVSRAERVWDRQFTHALSNPWGGTWWNRDHTFANAPAAGPIALWYARRGDVATAERLADWLNVELRDPETGLVFDGMREIDGERIIERHLYTYNQGTAIGLGLALGGRHVARVADLIDGVAEHLTVGPDLVATAGGGDGGLFGGILGRYLAVAAADERLDHAHRAQAGRMVTATADALWKGRNGTRVFPSSPLRPIDPETDTRRVPLPEQIQAWTLLEAASVVERLGVS